MENHEDEDDSHRMEVVVPEIPPNTPDSVMLDAPVP